MPLPVDVSTRQVHGAWLDMAGNPRSGTVTFAPTAEQLINPGSSTVITGTVTTAYLDASGEVTVTLPCTDDPDLSGGPFSYLVTVTLTGTDDPYAFWLDVPDVVGTLELADVTPILPAEGGSTVVLTVNGETGHVVLSPADIGAETAGTATAALAAHVAAADPHGDRAYAVQRANHTGTQTASTISDFSTAVASTALLKANDLSDLASASTARTNIGLGVAGGMPVMAYNYGFRCDGSQASAAANDAAFAAAEAVAYSQQTWVRLPPGYGYISVPMAHRSRVGIEGTGHYGTVIQLADDSNCNMIENYVSSDGIEANGMFGHIRNLALDGRGAHQSGAGPYHGIYFTTNPDVGSQASGDLAYDATHLVQNVVIRNTKGDGINVEGRSDVRISDTKTFNTGRNGIRARFDTHISSCVIEKPGQAGIYIWGSSCQITDTKVFIAGQDTSSLCGMAAVPDSGHGFVVTGSGIGEVVFASCDAQEVTGAGFWIGGGCNAVNVQGTVQKSSFGNLASAWPSVVLDNASNCVVKVTSKNLTGINGLALLTGSDRNSITMGHTPIPSNSVSELLTSGSAVLANRIVVNGAPLATEQDWAASTDYIKGQVLRGPLGARYQVSTAHTSGATFATTNLLMVEGPWPGQPVPSGTYVQLGTTGTSTSAIAAGSLRAYAWYLPHPTTLTKIFAEVTTIGDVGSKVRLGLYADTGLMRPGSLILDAGTILGDSATVQEITISQTLARGLYWVSAVSQDVTTTTPTVRTATPLISINSSTLPTAGESSGGWTHGTTIATGALPATFTPSGKTSVVPRIGVKAA